MPYWTAQVQGPVYDQGGEIYNVKACGAKGNVIQRFDGVTNTTTTFTSATGTFSATDVGKTFVIGSQGFVTTIASVQSATSITLTAAATATASALTYSYGTDDTATVQAVVNLAATIGGTVYFPAGIYFLNNIITPLQSTYDIIFKGAGRDSTTLMCDSHGANWTIALHMAGKIQDLSVDANLIGINGIVLSTSLVNQVAAGNIGATTSGSAVISLTGNIPVAVNDIIGVWGAGAAIGGSKATLTGTASAVSYNSGTNITSVTIATAASATVSAAKVFYGSAYSPISSWEVSDTNIRNIPSTSPGYGLQILDNAGLYPFQIDTLRLRNVTAGPSYSTLQEVINIVNVNNCFVDNLEMTGITGRVGPNFFAVNNLVVNGLIINLSTAVTNDVLVLGGTYGAESNHVVNGLIINDPYNVGQPIEVYSQTLQATNWNIPQNGKSYVHLNLTNNNQLASFSNCFLGAGIGMFHSPMTLKLDNCYLGIVASGSTGCITNNNAGDTGWIFATNTIFDNLNSTASGIIHSTSATIVAQVKFSNCQVLNNATPKVVSEGTYTGTVEHVMGLSPTGVLAAPAVPASATAVTNPFYGRCTVYVQDTGTGTSIAIDGTSVGSIAAGAVGTFTVPLGATITPTYTTAPTWHWVGA